MSSVQNPSDSLQRPGTSCSHPQPSLFSSSPPHIPQIQITGSQISQESDITRHNQRRRLMGSYSQPRATAQTELCEDCGDSKKPRSFFSRAIGSIHRKLSPNRGKSSTPVPPPEQDVNDQRATLNTDHNTDSTSVHAQLRHKGINVPPLSELAAAPLSSSDTGRKKTIIGATRLILQSAVSALRFSPVPNLDAIPNLLLTWLQLYETVDGNDENLKGLNDEVKRAYTTILQPLQMWTSQAGEIPPEVVSLIKEFHSDLEEQVRRIKSLESQKVGKRVISATEITQKIADVKTCVANAVSRFATVATTLNLLSTIRTSVDYELSKLAKADAEYFSVKSKSECLETTRDKIRSSILDHLKDPKNRFVWLRGSPGTGKTAVSLSVASTLDNQGCLAASFFWDKNQQGTGLDSIERFPSTLALQLAEFSPEYKSLLIKELRHPQSLKKVQGPVLEKQMQAWIINPIRQLGDILSSEKDRFIIILDGLDECGDPGTLESLMKLVVLLHKLPSAFAALVSCRPETQVVTAWDEARDQGLIIPCEDVDKISKDETFHTIRLMVEEGLRDCIKKSTWKPTSEDLDAFAFACRGLPIMASIRVRDVALQTRHGRTLQSEFRHLCNLIHAPADLNSEYLRILHRAYMPDRSRIHPEVAKNYHAVIGTMVTAPVAFSVHGMSQILEISEDEVRATLEPISSMVDLPSDNAEDIKFYHATAREFVTGDPIGEGSDKVFFIHGDKYFLGLPLLRFINGISERNGLDIPIEHPLGDEKKWKSFVTKQWPIHVNYAFNRESSTVCLHETCSHTL
ncbi:uncharacterized protein EI90DRAFT_586263 [Cantharellus anzutake]|uniref:uncharacterized protein n=1 Tax=Cantharellus anzutake TaxID=1750568 RepID=UPI001906B488|nr:uncharacterized protein EI90DRAFT_586263 [Cantharellus anzutake]KAF8333607.1 hypothetical protein EI90DRAFT_586263 [Cantharellus anzutake]